MKSALTAGFLALLTLITLVSCMEGPNNSYQGNQRDYRHEQGGQDSYWNLNQSGVQSSSHDPVQNTFGHDSSSTPLPQTARNSNPQWSLEDFDRYVRNQHRVSGTDALYYHVYHPDSQRFIVPDPETAFYMRNIPKPDVDDPRFPETRQQHRHFRKQIRENPGTATAEAFHNRLQDAYQRTSAMEHLRHISDGYQGALWSTDLNSVLYNPALSHDDVKARLAANWMPTLHNVDGRYYFQHIPNYQHLHGYSGASADPPAQR